MLPHPVNALGGLIAQVVTAEIAAEKKNEAHFFAVNSFKLMNLGRFFLAALVRVGEITRRLGLDQDGYAILPHFLGLDHHINWNIYLDGCPDGQIHSE